MEMHQTVPVDAQLRTWLAAGVSPRVDPPGGDLPGPFCPLLPAPVRGPDGPRERRARSRSWKLPAAGMAQFRAEASVKTWLFAIAHREALHALARQRRQGTLPLRGTWRRQMQVYTEISSTLEDRVSAHDVARLRVVLTHAALAPLDRSIIMLRFGIEVPQALAVAEIARLLRLSRATVYRRLTHLLAAVTSHDGPGAARTREGRPSRTRGCGRWTRWKARARLAWHRTSTTGPHV